MSFGSSGAGDADHDGIDPTVDAGDFDGSDADDFSDDYDDTSWDEALDMIDSDFGDFFSDNEGSSDDTVFEAVLHSDNDVCDGQLSLFEADDEDVDEVDVATTESSLDSEEVLSDEIDTLAEESEVIEGQVDVEEFLDYQEDLHHTPSYDSSLGQWSGMRGDSLFIPSDAEAQRVLSELGLEGIPYHEAQPDFSDVTAATVYLSQDDMELGDAEQKAMANYTLADDLVDEESEDADEVTEEENIENVNTALIESVLADEVDEFYGALLSGDVPASFVWHHGDADADGDYPYSLIPSSIHDACRHRGGRSHSGTKR